MLHHQLLSGVRPLLAVLCSSAGGARLLAGDPATAGRLLQGLDPGSLPGELLAGLGEEQPAGGPAAVEGAGELPAVDAAGLLAATLVAHAAVVDLIHADRGSPAAATAVHTLAAALQQGAEPSSQQAVLLALAAHSDQALPRLLALLRSHCALLAAAAGPGPAGRGGPAPGGSAVKAEPGAADGAWLSPRPSSALSGGSGNGGSPVLDELLDSAAESAEAAGILEALAGEAHPDVLGRWAPRHAEALQAAVEGELRRLPPHAAMPACESGRVAAAGAPPAAWTALPVAVCYRGACLVEEMIGSFGRPRCAVPARCRSCCADAAGAVPAGRPDGDAAGLAVARAARAAGGAGS